MAAGERSFTRLNLVFQLCGNCCLINGSMVYKCPQNDKCFLFVHTRQRDPGFQVGPELSESLRHVLCGVTDINQRGKGVMSDALYEKNVELDTRKQALYDV